MISFRQTRFIPAIVLLLPFTLAGCGHISPTSTGPTAPHVSGSAAAAPASGLFRDVAHEAGVDFRWGHGGKSPLTIIETLGHGTAFLDYDQDGLLDILLVGNRRLALYHNLGSGHFQDVTREAGLTAEGDFYGVAVGDYDNDGYPDIYITGYGKCLLYHNTAGPPASRDGVGGQNPNAHAQGAPAPEIQNRTFQDVTARAGVGARSPYDCVTAAAFVDLDGDGRLDLVAGRYILYKPGVIQFCTYQGVRAGCGVKNYDPDAPQVYRNNGDGTFTNMTRPWGFGKAHGRCLGVAVRASDDGHGVQVYLANDELPGDLFVRRGTSYVETGVESGAAYNKDGLTQGGMGADWGDYLNEGRPGLIVTTFQSEPHSIYRNEGRGLYREIGATMNIAAGTTAWVGWTAKFFDYDNDGWLDLVVTNGHSQDNVHQVEADRSYAQPILLYHNEQGNLFQEVAKGSGGVLAQWIVGRGGSVGDFDNDGRMDLLLVDEEGPARLLQNVVKSANHWLGIRLVGTHCNRDAIGARVLVTAGGRTLLRDQQLAGGYLSAHDPRLHFGLGSAAKVDKIVVKWPDGHVDTVKDVPADRYIEITEGRRRL
jgi:hypothetical protein